MCHFNKEKGTGHETHPAIVSGIVTGHAPVSYWLNFFLVPSNNPRSLCESQLGPVSFACLNSILKHVTHGDVNKNLLI